MEPMQQAEETRESWYGVKDARQRKRIQDRLAQRARRKRLAEASENSKKALVVRRGHGTRPQSVSASAESSDSNSLTSQTAWSISMCTGPRLVISPSRVTATTPVGSDHTIFVSTVVRALDENGQRIGLHYSCVGISTSWRQPPTVPDILHPTPLQLATPHRIWIDRLPFPRMRDNMILLADTINSEEFYNDLFYTDSFQLKDGAAPYDPAAWRIHPFFREKWGYLFH